MGACLTNLKISSVYISENVNLVNISIDFNLFEILSTV